jgi:hypothetical protein
MKIVFFYYPVSLRYRAFALRTDLGVVRFTILDMLPRSMRLAPLALP